MKGRKQYTQEEFIEKASKIFPEYDFSKTIYKGSNIKVLVGRPRHLLQGIGACKYCATEKRKSTTLECYGVEHVMQFSNFKEKQKETMNERYGVKHPMQSSEFKEKKIEATYERYGVEYPMQSSESKEKQKETMLDRYGVKNPMQSLNFKEKRKETLFNKHNY